MYDVGKQKTYSQQNVVTANHKRDSITASTMNKEFYFKCV